MEGAILYISAMVFQGSYSQRPKHHFSQWVLGLKTGSGIETKWRITTFYWDHPHPHDPPLLILIYLLLILVIDVKQHCIHAQMKIWAKIQNDSYADFWEFFLCLDPSCLTMRLQIQVTSVSPISNLCLRSHGISVLCLRSRESIQRKSSPHVLLFSWQT